MTTEHSIDLTHLSRPQLKQLETDLASELERREHEDREELNQRLRDLTEAAGFDPDQVHFGKPRVRRGKSNRKNGANDHA